MKNILFIGIVTTILYISSFAVRADAATFYVAKTGSDANTGTLSKPLKTIRKALTKVAAGDTIAIRAGTYNEIVEVTKSGTSSARIDIKNYNNENVVIKSPDWAGITLRKVNYVTISGLKVTGMQYDGVFISGGHHNIIKNVEVYGNTNSSGVGIHITSKDGVTSDNVITGCKIHDVKQEAIYVDIKSAYPYSNDRNIIENNTIYNAKEGIQNTNEYGVAPFPNGTVISNNIISNISNGEWAVMDLSGSNLVVKNNKISNCLAGVGGIWYSNGTGTIITGNTIYNNTSRFSNGAGITAKKFSSLTVNSNTVTNQKIQNSQSIGIAFLDTKAGFTQSANIISGTTIGIATIINGTISKL